MKRAKQYILLFAILLASCQVFAQKDSVKSLFKPIKTSIQYKNLQWEGGYNGFLFNKSYLAGSGYDIFGAVFDEVDIAFGFDNAGSGNSFRYVQVPYSVIISYSDFYLKFEPLLFPEKIINMAMPIKLALSTMTYADTGTVTNAGGRRRARLGTTFPSITAGLFTYINLFPKWSFGVGVNYRLALSSSSTFSSIDYSNFCFSALVRFKIYTRNLRKIAAKQNSYATPGNRFQ
ncbi:MAG TPA: hypothetical protein VK890_03850 [Bacteroidia bacterium]|jgi:hypothetical protein|nr:hypothetical protein [Bacteroidia bacterium]